LRLFSFGGYGPALAALALVVFGAIECLPVIQEKWEKLHLISGGKEGGEKTQIKKMLEFQYSGMF